MGDDNVLEGLLKEDTPVLYLRFVEATSMRAHSNHFMKVLSLPFSLPSLASFLSFSSLLYRV